MKFRARQMDALNAWKLQSFGVTIEEILKIQEFLNAAHKENVVITLILDIECPHWSTIIILHHGLRLNAVSLLYVLEIKLFVNSLRNQKY